MDDKRNSQRRTILRNSPDAGGLGPTQTHLYMDGSRLMAQQYDGTAKTIIDLSAIPATVPVGSITQFGGDDSSTPSGWKLCNGDHFSTTGTYADLFAVIGYNYGRTNSSGVSDSAGTYFKLPDLRGRVPINRDSSDTDFDTLGETGGTKDANVPAHTHQMTSTEWGDGYFEAREAVQQQIIDFTSPQHNNTGGWVYTGQSPWGAGDDCTNYGTPSSPIYRDTVVEMWAGSYGASDGTCGSQTGSDNFSIATDMTQYPLQFSSHAEAGKNNTLQVSGTILASGVGIDGDGSTGSGSSGANMVPYVVVNSIIRYA